VAVDAAAVPVRGHDMWPTTRQLWRLVRAALDQQGVAVDRLRWLGEHTNHLFRVDAATGERLVVRACLPDGRSDAELDAELAWLAALARDTDLTVPAARFSTHLATPDLPGGGRCIAFAWVQGRHCQAGPLATCEMPDLTRLRRAAEGRRDHRWVDSQRLPHPTPRSWPSPQAGTGGPLRLARDLPERAPHPPSRNPTASYAPPRLSWGNTVWHGATGRIASWLLPPRTEEVRGSNPLTSTPKLVGQGAWNREVPAPCSRLRRPVPSSFREHPHRNASSTGSPDIRCLHRPCHRHRRHHRRLLVRYGWARHRPTPWAEVITRPSDPLGGPLP
jgi:hypothetical protein